MGLRVFAVALTLLAMPIPSASAQSFLESLFGFGGSSPSRSYGRSRERTRAREPRESSRDYSRESSRDTPSRQARAYYNAPQTYERSGTYRTYCVRMCDGFYFPLHYSSTSLTRDAQRCSASCDGARLFYHRTGGEPEEMVDMNGRAYTSYPIAFKHRRELVQGCQCRPPPWTDTELARHRAYAFKLKPPGAQSPIPPPRSKGAAASIGSSTPPVLPAANNAAYSLRPAPIARPEPVEATPLEATTLETTTLQAP